MPAYPRIMTVPAISPAISPATIPARKSATIFGNSACHAPAVPLDAGARRDERRYTGNDSGNKIGNRGKNGKISGNAPRPNSATTGEKFSTYADDSK